MIPLQAVPLTMIPTSTTTTGTPGEGTEKLAKAMENMSLQKTKNKKLQYQLSNLQEQFKRKYSTHATELQISKKLNEGL